MPKYTVIVQGGYMSGDMFGVAAAMLLDPKVCVLILKGTDPDYLSMMDDVTDRQLEPFYKECLGPTEASRCQVQSVDNPLQYIKTRTQNGQIVADNDLKNKFGLKSTDTYNFVSIGTATTIVANKYPTQSLSLISGFVVERNSSALKTFVQTKCSALLSHKGPRLFLWVRINKKKPKATAHLELDTSVEGLRQIVGKVVAENVRRQEASLPTWQVILTGDRAFQIQDEKNAILAENCLDLMEYWKDRAWNAGWGRREQLTLFYKLKTLGHPMVHLGMRSGALEGPALLGVPTVYLEEQGNQQGSRMEKWTKVTAMSYHRVELDQLPTRTGQAIKEVSITRSPAQGDAAKLATQLDEFTQERVGTNRDRLLAAKEEFKKASGSSFDDFFSEYITLAWSDWKRNPAIRGFLTGYDSYDGYRRDERKWANNLETRVGQWFDIRVRKENFGAEEFSKGFTTPDLLLIMDKLEELMPDPTLPSSTVQGSNTKATSQ
jgi:hypothetical protein